MDLIAKSFSEIELDGKTYRIGKLTLGDFADFEEWVRQQREEKILSTARKVYGDDMPDNILDKMLSSPTDEEIEQERGSISGVRFLLWRAFGKYCPNITLDEVSAMVTLDDLSKISKVIMPNETTPKKNSIPKKKQRRH
jgi:hypothetical protein